MNETDVQTEWSSLVEAYSAMSDEELSSLAGQAYELTELAQQALQAEVKARRLAVDLVRTPPQPSEPEEQEPTGGDFDPEELDLVPLDRVWYASRASDIMKKLHDGGVPAYLGPDNAEKIEDFRGNFEAGVDIRVRAVDRYRANATLAALSPTDGDNAPATEEEPHPAHCPKCGSDEVVFEELVAGGAPDSVQADKFRWRCDACGHEWQDDGVTWKEEDTAE